MSIFPAISMLQKFLAFLTVIFLVCSTDCTQAAGRQPGAPNTREEKLSAPDGWPIHATYYESAAGKESPVVILLAAAEGPDKKDARNRRVWQNTALGLQKSGFAVIAVDLRKHGDSIPELTEPDSALLRMSPTDYVVMAASDMEAVKTFLLSEHHREKLNIRKTGIVSVGSSAMVAAAFAVADWAQKPYPDGPTPEASTPRGQDVRALIMYSPNANVKGISSTTILRAINSLPIAVHVVASSDIKEDARNADRIFKAVEIKDDLYKDKRKLTTATGEIAAEGFLEGRFADPTNKDITEFLTRNLKELDMPWMSRKSRLQ
jgi:pimeloyl-ACP methyl ester carboxylesterase